MDLEKLFIKVKAMDDNLITKYVTFSLVKKADNYENENYFINIELNMICKRIYIT